MTYMIAMQEKSARACAQDVHASSKQCIEICSFLRGKNLDTAIATMQRVMEKKQAVPFRRFTNGVGHRSGEMAAGRYPIKAAGEFLQLLTNVKANANNIGLTGTLRITHIAANRASRPMRNRLKYRGEFKRTHIEVIVTETAPAPKKETKKEPAESVESPKQVEKQEKPARKTPAKKAPKKEESHGN